MEWIKDLPKCPKKLCFENKKPVNPNPSIWHSPAILGWPSKNYHAGLRGNAYEMRSKPTGKGCGNQCIYDDKGDVVRTIPTAGTADRVAPSGGYSKGHITEDVDTFTLAVELDGGRIGWFTAISEQLESTNNIQKYYNVRPIIIEE